MTHFMYFIFSIAVVVAYFAKTYHFWYKREGDATDAVFMTFITTFGLFIGFLVCIGLWAATK
jgi:hypothetical protein